MRVATLGFIAFVAGQAFPVPAQAQSGRDLFVRADKGHCIACHQVPDGAGPATRSDLGPRLDGPRVRTIDRAALRALLVDPTQANPASVMPPFGRHRILDAAEIERVIDYLHALP